MSTQFSALVYKLKEIFQINRPDLDFGVYRILNARSAEIAEFLDRRLKAKVEQYLGEAKSSFDENKVKELEAELKAEFGKRAFNDQGELIDTDAIESALGQKYIALTQADINEMTDQSQVYSHLLTFFSRYYDEGDFISQRRYKGDTYAIPYSGEEVMLHWANKDQYYTKSGEMFSNYRFKLNDERSVLFRLVSADTARENRKDNDKSRHFEIAPLTQPIIKTFTDEDGEEIEEKINPISIVNSELVIYFQYVATPKGTKQEALNKQTYELIIDNSEIPENWLHDLQQLASTEKEPKRTVLQKHLSNYTQKNTADYFIHKNLGRFLRHELDFYIKNEVMHLDDVVSTDQFIQIERQLSIIKCLRQIGLEIISFLASLEDFQKKLWLKKKFVVSAEYCITLDRVDESLYAEITANIAQWQQWEDLGFKGTDAGWGTVDYLKQHQALMVDTSLFGPEFKAKLLQKIDDLDAQTDGLIIHSDNFQALNLIKKKYKQVVDCIYIDPPYNAKSSEILYKNTFKHSSWLSMIESRLDLAERLMHANSSFVMAIDENEQLRLGLLLESKFSSRTITCISLIHNPGGIQGSNFSYTHESAFFIYPDNPKAIGLKKRESSNRVALRDWGGDESKRETAKNCFYPVYIRNNKIIGFGDVCKDNFHPKVNEVEGDVIAVYPIDNDGVERKWRNARGTVESIFEELEISEANGKFLIYRNKSFYRHKTVWDDSLYNSNVYGSKLLGDIVGNKVFSYPKSLYTVKDSIKAATNLFEKPLVLDYFAGSGTTAHATIALNREDQGKRKYILVEQGEYFDTVIKPRIQKVVYSADWKDGKPTNSKSGISHCLKVVKLESYEDTLNNLELVRKGTQQNLLAEQQASTKPEDQQAYNDYLMHYMLELESKDSLLNVKDFLKPFSYQMNITTDSAGAFERKNIDLVETFNYLIGLNVQDVDYQLDKGYVQITGKLRTGEYTTILWRDCEKVGYAELDKLLAKLKINPNDGEYQLIYINGDHNVASKYISKEGEEKQLKVRSIEQTFLKNMFEE